MSKLGGHFMNGGNPQPWVAAGARIFKFAPEVLGLSLQVPAGPLVIGKLDQRDDSLHLTDWKDLMRQGYPSYEAAAIRFTTQTAIYTGPGKPRVNRYLANPRVDVWEDDNEIQPDNAAEAVWFSDYCIEMMMRYDGIGKKRANFSFAVGTPDLKIWSHLLPAVKYARDHGHYLALHEYMGFEADLGVGWKQLDENRRPTDFTWHGRLDDSNYPWGWAALRYRLIYDTVLNQAGLADVRLLITELGCDDVTSVTPAGMPVGSWKAMGLDEATYTDHLLWYDRRIREDAYVAGAVVFTVGSVGNWANWDIAGTNVETLLLEEIRATANETDPVLPQPDNPPPPIPQEPFDYLTNGNFEGGWEHPGGVAELQVPKGWTLNWRDGREPWWENPFDKAEHARFVRPEIRTLPKSQLPIEEQNLFVRDGEYCLKAFKGNGSLYFSLIQKVTLPAGRFRFEAPIYPDLVERYENYQKVWAHDPNSGLARIRIGAKPITNPNSTFPFSGGWVQLTPGQWNDLCAEFETGSAELDIKIDFLLPFALPQNGIFADKWRLTMIQPASEPPVVVEPPVKHTAVVVKLPQGCSLDLRLEAAKYAHPFRHTVTDSHHDMMTILDGGNINSFVKVVRPDLQSDVVKLIEAAGYRWEPVLSGPLDGLLLGAPFAWRYVLTSPFNAARSYGKHEGADYDIIGGNADNKVDVLCLHPGIIDRATTSSGYGKYVRVRHERNGNIFYTRLAHMDKVYVDVGQQVETGTPLGEVGATGNASGEHVHINIEIPGAGLPGYCVADVIDPAPYIPSGLALPLYTPTPSAPLIDLYPYLRGDGRCYMVRHPQDGSQEKFRTVDRAGRWLQLKNSQWEELWLSDGMIWRGKDTSAGEGNYYRQYEDNQEGARWCPRHMFIGQVWISPAQHTVQTYTKSGCTPVVHHRNGRATNRVKLVGRYDKLTWNGITVEDVILLETHTGELMWFARGYGLVAWSSEWGVSAIAHLLPANEADNKPEEGCFG